MKVVSSEAHLIRVFTSLLEAEKSVKLVFSGQRHTKEIGISNANILYATSNLLKDKLSEILFKAGKLTQDQYMLASEMSIVTQKRTGKILISEGFLTKKEVTSALRYQARKIISDLFENPDWKLRITKLDPAGSMENAPGLSVTDAMMAGIRSVDNLTVLFDATPRMDEVPEIAPDREDFMKRTRLLRDEDLLLHLVDGNRTLQEIFEASRMLEFRFYKTLYPFMVLNILRRKKKPVEVRVEKKRTVPVSATVGDSGSAPEMDLPEGPVPCIPDAQALFEEAKLLLSMERYSEAATRLKNLIRQDNKKSGYYYYLGLALDHIPSQNKEAETVFKMAIKLENYNSRYYLALGYLYLNRNMKRQAREQFMTALKWDKDDPYVLEALDTLDKLEKKGSGFLTSKLFRK